MYSKLSRWLNQMAMAIELPQNDARLRYSAICSRNRLFAWANAIDSVHLVFLRLRAKVLWRYDQVRSYLIKDEFDRSLDINTEIALYLSKNERSAYMTNLYRRRQKAHNRDI